MKKQAYFKFPFALQNLNLEATCENSRKAKENGKVLVIYGVGVHAIPLFFTLKEMCVEVDCFSDSDSSKHGTEFLNKAVLNPEELLADGEKFTVIIGADCFSAEIESFLIGKGFPQENIASVFNSTEEFILIPKEILPCENEAFAFETKPAETRVPPQAAFIMILYNIAPYYLRRAVESVLGQTCNSLTLIIFDNASTDGSAGIIREYAARDNRIKIVTFPENWVIKSDPSYLGECATKLKETIKASGARYVCQLDSDDYYAPEFLSEALEFENADMIAVRPIWYDEDSPQKIRYGNMSFDRRVFSGKNSIVDMRADYALSFSAYWAVLQKTEIFLNNCYGKSIIDTRDIIGSLSECERVAVINKPFYFHTEQRSNIPASLNWMLPLYETFAAIYESEKQFMSAFPSEKNTALIKQEFLNKVMRAVLPQLENANENQRDIVYQQARLALKSPLLDDLSNLAGYKNIMERLKRLGEQHV